MTGLALVRHAPTLDDRVTVAVAALRNAGLRAIGAEHHAEQYAAVIIPAPGAAHGYGQYQVEPHGDVLRIRWHRKDHPAAVTVADVDTPERAARLILDHLAGLYP